VSGKRNVVQLNGKTWALYINVLYHKVYVGYVAKTFRTTN